MISIPTLPSGTTTILTTPETIAKFKEVAPEVRGMLLNDGILMVASRLCPHGKAMFLDKDGRVLGTVEGIEE